MDLLSGADVLDRSIDRLGILLIGQRARVAQGLELADLVGHGRPGANDLRGGFERPEASGVNA